MGITQLGLAHQPFDHMYLIPVGGEVQATPSKLSSRSLLHQLDRYMGEAWATLTSEEQHKIATLTKLPGGKFNNGTSTIFHHHFGHPTKSIECT